MRKVLFAAIVLLISYQSAIAQGFTGSFDLVVNQQSPGGNERIDTVSYYFSGEKTAVVIHGRSKSDPGIRLVFNSSDSTITGLFEMNGKKGGYVLPMDLEHWPGLPHSVENVNKSAVPETRKTGETKNIGNFLCHEMKADSEDYSVTMWVANEIPLSMTRVLSYQSVGKGKSREEVDMFKKLGVEHLPLEMHLKSKQGKSDISAYVINLKDSPDISAFSTDGHSVSEIE
ncbi:MAG: hypothetical protein KDC05_10490 [Bacteroidales bacterium]|nr:hypothetical protein [Bacteroidales bacterium]